MTRDELNQIKELNLEVIMWQMELDRIECKSLVKAQAITGMPFGSGISDPTFNLAVERERYRKIIDGILCKIQVVRNNIMRYIESIDDSSTRQILFLKCISGYNWHRIAREMGEGYTADCVKQTYYRRLKKDNIK